MHTCGVMIYNNGFAVIDEIHAVAWWYTKPVGLDKKTKDFIRSPLFFGGDNQIWTDESGCCRPTPYHLAMSPYKKMERMTRLELATSTLARWRSTRWATSAYKNEWAVRTTHPWCLRSESNQRHEDFQSSALPTELQRQKKWRPGTGSNRRPLAWQASVLTNWTTGPPLGGNNRARTYDPLLVRQMLSQLSYAPMRSLSGRFCYWQR